jgi:hypothetical protein
VYAFAEKFGSARLCQQGFIRSMIGNRQHDGADFFGGIRRFADYAGVICEISGNGRGG